LPLPRLRHHLRDMPPFHSRRRYYQRSAERSFGPNYHSIGHGEEDARTRVSSSRPRREKRHSRCRCVIHFDSFAARWQDRCTLLRDVSLNKSGIRNERTRTDDLYRCLYGRLRDAFEIFERFDARNLVVRMLHDRNVLRANDISYLCNRATLFR